MGRLTKCFVLLLIGSFSFPVIAGADISISEPPRIIFAPKRTARTIATIRGRTCPQCEVIAKLDGRVVGGKSDERGFFEVEIPLRTNGENEVLLHSQKGNRKSPPVQLSIVQYELPIPLRGSPPVLDEDGIPKYTNSPGIRVFGRALPGSKVVIVGGSARAEGFSDEKGFFDILVFLKFDQLNEIEVYYEDEKGFISPKTVIEIYQITRAPPTPLIQKLPRYTNSERVRIKGKTVPGFKVLVELPTGSRVERDVDAEKGTFEVEAYLIPNAENRISVYTLDHAGNVSAPERLEIIQDSIPPNPPEVDIYPSRAYQDRISVVGRGEPDAKIVAHISGRTHDVGVVDKVGRFIADVPVLRFKKQVRRNYISLHLEDRAGNVSAPTLIAVDAMPDIRQVSVGFNAGAHMFLGAASSEFFRDIGMSPLDFTGPFFEIRYIRLLQRGSGPGLMLTGGFTSSLPKRMNIPQLQDPAVNILGSSEEVSKIRLHTIYLTLNFGVALFFEDFDFMSSVGAGGLSFVKSGPAQVGNLIMREDRAFLSYTVRTDLIFRYSIGEHVSLYGVSAFSFSPVSNVNERGSSVDAGGLIFGIGLSFDL